jgi:hypothetical protein
MNAMGTAVVTDAVVGAEPVTTWLTAVELVTPVRLTVPLITGFVESGVSVSVVPLDVSGHCATGNPLLGGMLTPMSVRLMLVPLGSAPRI